MHFYIKLEVTLYSQSEYKKLRYSNKCRGNGRRFHFTVVSAVSCHCQKCDSVQYVNYRYKQRRSSSTGYGSFHALNGEYRQRKANQEQRYSNGGIIPYKEVDGSSFAIRNDDATNSNNNPPEHGRIHDANTEENEDKNLSLTASKKSSQKSKKQDHGYTIMR